MNPKTNRGFTLIEVILALGIFAAVIISTTTLVRHLLRADTEAGRRTQAVALANKEYELLREYRDRLYEQGRSWSANMPATGPGGCVTFVMSDSSGVWRPNITLTPEPFSTNPDEFESLYSRIVEMCESREYDLANSSYHNSENVRTVEITVNWEEQSSTRTTVVRGLLTNWNSTP